MAYDVNQIIPITVRISPSGLGFANFAKAVGFAPESELPLGFAVDTFRTYNTLTSLAVDFADTTETYKMAQRWFTGLPGVKPIDIWGKADADATITATLDKARNIRWWFWSFFTKDIHDNLADVALVAAWSETNRAYFMNCQGSAVSVADIRDPNSATDIATTLTTIGYRYSSTFAHATDPYAGIGVTKWFANMNPNIADSTITAEYKKLSGVPAEDLTDNEYAAMTQATKKCQFYSVVDLQGSTDNGRILNSWSHSSFGEFMDDVFNLELFLNSLQVTLYNTVANQPSKLAQTPAGQAVLIGQAKSVCEQYIQNNYLGPRNYIDPDDGLEKFTRGYEILTLPEDILDLTDPERDARLSAPMRIRLYRAGAIHSVPVQIDVY